LKNTFVELILEREKSHDLQSPMPSLVQKEGWRDPHQAEKRPNEQGLGAPCREEEQEEYPGGSMKRGDLLERRSGFQEVLYVEMLFTSQGFFCSPGCRQMNMIL